MTAKYIRLKPIIILIAAYLSSVGAIQAETAQKNLTLMGIPSATVAPHGVMFGVVSWTNKRNSFSNSSDASGAVGIGFGSAEKNIGLQFTTNITSFSDDFGDSGFLSIKASRRIAKGDNPVYASLSFGNLSTWGDAKAVNESVNFAVSRFSQISTGLNNTFPVMFTVGYGNKIKSNFTEPGVFLGAGIGLSEIVGASISTTGNGVDLGASFKFKPIKNMQFGVTTNDIFDENGLQRIVLTLSWYLSDVFGG
jgi:hypothetical protein